MYAVRRPVENVYLVRERDRRRTRELLAFVLAAVPPVVVLFAAVWANLETVRLGYQIEKLARQREALVEKRRQLELDRAQASALARIEPIARGKLGLAAPRPEQLLYVRSLEAPAPAAPAPSVQPVPPAPSGATPALEGGR